MTDTQLCERLRATAESVELAAVDFLDGSGNHGNQHDWVTIRCTFHDGTVIDVPRRLEKFFNRQTFKLREKGKVN